jgi:pimeloyl-ACP methyl ester carboxylesterase
LIPTRWTRNEDLKFLVLADHLTRLGIAVLRVDGRGMGGTSKGLVASPTDPDYADDALEAVEFLKGRPEADPKKIGLLGHSEGARIVTSAATRSKDISFVVLLGAAGISGGQNFLQQNLTMMAVDGEPKEKIVLHRKLIEKVLAGVGKYKELEDAEFRKRLTAICADEMKKFSNDELERAEGKPSLDIFAGSIVKFFSSSWGRYYALNEPTETIAKLKCPVLALTGEKDLQVAPKENLAAIARALKNGKNQDFTVKELPDLNHNFQTCKTGEWAEYSLLEETFAPGALDMIASWILKHNI